MQDRVAGASLHSVSREHKQIVGSGHGSVPLTGCFCGGLQDETKASVAGKLLAHSRALSSIVEQLKMRVDVKETTGVLINMHAQVGAPSNTTPLPTSHATHPLVLLSFQPISELPGFTFDSHPSRPSNAIAAGPQCRR
ncbi:unnamed protein product [Pleuronectes platessa]|uniref:Uncharacterized protein n=1 Tax=Pleuronectes platessa TaxID=8262 RepID=A0A9N7V2X9_PLEPL|nr:unnamed protein product [Pleuronectes platessa]